MTSAGFTPGPLSHKLQSHIFNSWLNVVRASNYIYLKLSPQVHAPKTNLHISISANGNIIALVTQAQRLGVFSNPHVSGFPRPAHLYPANDFASLAFTLYLCSVVSPLLPQESSRRPSPMIFDPVLLSSPPGLESIHYLISVNSLPPTSSLFSKTEKVSICVFTLSFTIRALSSSLKLEIMSSSQKW